MCYYIFGRVKMLKYDKNNSGQIIQFTITAFAIILLIILALINISYIDAFITGILNMLSPIIIGAAVAYVLNPLLKFFERVVFKRLRARRFVRVISLILTYLVALLAITVVLAIVLPRIIFSFFRITSNINSYLDTATNFVNTIIAKFISDSPKYNSTQIAQIVGDIFTESGDVFKTIISVILSYFSGLISTLKNVFLGLFVSIYILVSKEKLTAQAAKCARAFLSNKTYRNTLKYIRKTNATFGKFFIGKIVESSILALLIVSLLLIFRMEYCLLIGTMIGIFNLVPFFGIIIAIIISAFLILIATPDRLLLFIILMIIVYQIDINILAPKILGKSAGISSLGVIVAVIIMGEYLGVVGMIIAVPIFSIIISIIKDWIEGKLKKKQLPTSTKEYYSNPDFSIQSDERKTASMIIVDKVFHIADSAISGIKHTLEADEDNESANDTHNDKDNSSTD